MAARPDENKRCEFDYTCGICICRNCLRDCDECRAERGGRGCIRDSKTGSFNEVNDWWRDIDKPLGQR